MRTQPVGSGESFMGLMDRVSDVASTERPVLIVGERGTGKELIASRLHFLSPRWEKVNVRVNCAAFDDVALDRELFGQTFMDGRSDTNGRVFGANEGTLFLDSIEEMPLHLQEKLMHTIEHGQVQATGELYEEDVDVRVVAATSVDLPSAVARGAFRGDLLDRIAFHVITLPPLRERVEDIPALVDHFGRQVARSLEAEQFPGFTAEAQEAMRAHPFPGNVRELKLIVERSAVQAFLQDESLSQPIDTLDIDPFDSPYRVQDRIIAPMTQNTNAMPSSAQVQPQAPQSIESGPIPESFSDRVIAFERRLIDEALRATNDHQGKAAERLDLSYHQFRGLLRKHGLKK
ncbi:sigma 54-interacting transcriptional regulator [Algimonas ampicilliniresistens]|jgi:psp operon transcriptional activator|nr:sigma 54-interacting transcriptional regulator [Algimonas ampicilliniresistens]